MQLYLEIVLSHCMNCSLLLQEIWFVIWLIYSMPLLIESGAGSYQIKTHFVKWKLCIAFQVLEKRALCDPSIRYKAFNSLYMDSLKRQSRKCRETKITRNISVTEYLKINNMSRSRVSAKNIWLFTYIFMQWHAFFNRHMFIIASNR